MVLPICVVEGVSKHLDIPIWEFWAIWEHPPVLPECKQRLDQACPSQAGNLAITSLIFTAVIWDADEPCVEKTAWAPESSFYNVPPRSTTLPFYICNFGSNSACLRWPMSINVAKWTFLLSLCAFQNITSFLLLTFNQIPCWNRLELFPFIVHGSFGIRNFHRLWHRNKLVHLNCNVSSKQILFLQFDLREFWTAKILVAALWIHEIPLFNHTLFWISCHLQSLALPSLSWY